ncbi:MAG: tetratricopeptide repeat protein [Chlorobi bacterium]|nr:tetratricopeptide repeat protein [Chlorobiota bacterium]
MNFIYSIILCFTLSIINYSNANAIPVSKSDSLFNKFEKERNDTSKINILLELSYSLYKQGLLDSANSFLDKGIELSKKIDNSQKLVLCLDNKGKLLRMQGKFEKSLDTHFKALKIAEQLNLKKNLVQIYNNIGISYRRLSKDNMALKYHLRALKLAEGLNDMQNLATAYNSIGIIYTYQNNYREALSYFYLSLELAKKQNNMVGMAINLNSIAWVYELQKEYNSAIEFYNKSLAINIQLNNKKGIAISYTDLGNVYRKTGNYEKSLAYYREMLKINEEFNEDRYIARSHIYIGEVYMDLKNYKKALAEIKTGLDIAFKINSRRLLMDGYEQFANIYSNLGNYKKAFNYHKLYTQYKDSIYNEDNAKQIAELKTLYETEKKEKEIKLQKIELQQQETKIKRKNTQRNFFMIITVLLIIILFIAIRNYLKNKKINTLLIRQKEEITSQAKQLEKANTRILNDTRIKELFFANTSHEIRNPVNIIYGFTKLLLNSKLDKKQQSYINNIKNSSENLLFIINDILDFSKIEAGKLKIEKFEFSIIEKLNSIYKGMLPKAKEKKLKLNLIIEKDIPQFVKGDSVRLSQILTNLLTNAIKFTYKGEISINVKLLTQNYKFALIQFSVSDTGIGIKKNKLNTIFDAYSQAFNITSDNFGGTGLGLSIVKKLVEFQDGKITVESTVNKGSTFTFKIPYTIVEKIPETGLKNTTAFQKKDIVKKLSILLVDDNIINRTLAKDTILLFNGKILIDEAENGKEAVKKIENNNYDIILMDLIMPVMDGFEATKFVRNNLKYNIPILGMTALTRDEEKNKCFQCGMNDYISKPFEPDDLFQKIIKLTGK